MSDVVRVACAGDRFITAEALAEATVAAFGDVRVEVECIESSWPDEPFRFVDGVREAAGAVADVARVAADADVLLTHLAPVTADVLAGSRLRIVGVTRGGPVNVDLDAATRAGVPVAYLPGRNLGAVAEYTIALMLALPRSIVPSATTLRSGRWDARFFRFDLAGPELRAMTVGLVGLGAVGMRVAELARAFGATVLGHDPYADADRLRAAGVVPVELSELLARSDVVSLHARLTDDTRRMCDAGFLAAMKTGSYLVNTARGELVDQAALLAALEREHLSGAALDVVDPEPPDPSDPLLARPDVLVTPHLAGASRQVALESAQRMAAAVADFVATGRLDHCANPQWSQRR